MSSSLDDLEPYEIFQQELDAYLDEYAKILTPLVDKRDLNERVLALNHFIEFLCFVKMKSSFDEVMPEEVKTEFPNYLQENFLTGVNTDDLKRILNTYLDFIISQNKKHPKDVWERLKI